MTGTSKEEIYKQAVVSAGLSVSDLNIGGVASETRLVLDNSYRGAYTYIIDSVNWNCCKRVEYFTELSEDAMLGYSKVYLIPNNCYRINIQAQNYDNSSGNTINRNIGYNGGSFPVDFKIIQRKLYTTSDLGLVEYIKSIEPSEMSLTFENALVLKLAIALCVRYNNNLISYKEKLLNSAMAKAVSTEGKASIRSVYLGYEYLRNS